MNAPIIRVEIRCEQDVVHARQRARLIAGLLGLDRNDQTRLCTAVSEIARNTLQYGGGGEMEFRVEDAAPSQAIAVTARDRGPGISNLAAILEGRYTSPTGMGLGIVGARRLMDRFHIETRPGQGTTVCFGKSLPPTAPAVTPAVLRRITEALAAARAESPLEEIRTQNRELLGALDLLRQRDEELTRVNQELIETNSGIVALYSELEDHTKLLQQVEKALRIRNEDLTAFTYTVSHDLKAPLRGIMGYTSELERKHLAGLSERARFCVAQIATATQNLNRLIEDLLKYSRLEAETLSLSEVDLPRLVNAVLQEQGPFIGEHGVEVTVDIPFATLRACEPALMRVLANLVDNAIKYSCKATPPRLGIRAEALEAAWRIAVSDNGIGFDMKYHDRIFGLFNRLVLPEEFEGSGAGLAIVKKLLDRQGGRVWAEATPGQGATFFVELPKLGPP